MRVRDKDQQKAWKQANKDKVAATQKAFHERNPDYHKKWNAKNPGKVALKTRKHYEKATDKALARASRRRSRLISAEGSFTEAEWADMKAKFNHTCPRCQQVKPLSVDHIIPLSRGGSNWISNIQPLCCKCNSSKGTDIIRYQPPALAQ